MPNDAHQQTEPTDHLAHEEQRTAPRSTELQHGDVLAARYEIQALIGTGGMASVYRAFDRVTEQTIAIKVLDDDRSAGRAWVEHLGRELRHARRIKHPNVCQVFDFEDDGRCFLTMELAPRGTLRDTLEGDGARPLAQRLTDAGAVIEGVAAIHEAGVVHRDLKPENVLRAADGHLMVSDLGVAVRAADVTTHPGGPAGTRSYMAPELSYGDKATTASDVWSLGLILHEILFGGRPEWTLTGAGRRLSVQDGIAGPARPGKYQ
jgi:serine/threonine protein kinase